MTDQQFTTEELNSEEWKVIPDCTDYDVSSLGRVRRATKGRLRSKGYLLRLSQKRTGYITAVLYVNRRRKEFAVHRLVAIAFKISRRPDQDQINHINGVKTDNRLANLEWATRSENALHAINVLGKGGAGASNPSAKLRDVDILHIRALRKKGFSCQRIGGMFNVSHRAISLICNRQTWSHIE